MPGPTLSADGYVRLSPDSLLCMVVRHCYSELTEDVCVSPSAATGARVASIAGLTEWVSDSTPAVSLGWEWSLDLSSGRPRYVRAGPVNGNIMLINSGRGDLGPQATEALLAAKVDALNWQPETVEFINKLYACHLSDPTAALRPGGVRN